MRFAIIENNIVTDIILADQEFIDQLGKTAVNVTDMECGIGWMYNGISFAPPAPLPPSAPPVWEWYIDVGPFFDRFGDYKIPVLASTDINIQAMVKDILVRKWVDLKRNDVKQSLIYIGTKVGGFIAQEQNKVLDIPVAPEENLALRKLYFS